MIRKFVRPPLVLILAVFVILASIYSVVNPLYEGTDELRHFRFVRVLAETGHLPVQGQEPKRSQSHHPPLYHALGAAFTFWVPNQGDPYLTRPQNPYWGYHYWEVGTDNKNMYLHGPDEAFPWYGATLAAHMARFVNVALGALTVSLTAAILLVTFPHRPALGYSAAGLIAFNPMFLYMSGTVNNDVAAAAAGAAVTWACTLILRYGLTTRRTAVLGVIYGLALMTKFNLAFILPVIQLVILYRAICPPASRMEPKPALPTFFRANAIFLGLTAAIAGWWFIRNQILYGDPTGFSAVTELWGVRTPWESFGLAWSELPNAWSSLWGRFGYGQIPLPGWVYGVLAWGVGIGVLGALVGVSKLDAGVGPLLLFASALTFLVVLFAYMLVSPAGSMGRFFFPGLPAFAGLVSYGWGVSAQLITSVIRRITPIELSPCPRSLQLTVHGASNLAMLAFAIWALLGYLAPAYAIPAEISAEAVPHNLDLTLSDPDGPLVQLLGYKYDAESLRPGESLGITLYWRTIRPAGSNYVLFIHLLDDEGIMVTQRDTYPGLGNYPTFFWRPEHTFAESYPLHLPETAYAPTAVTPQVGLYSRDWVYRLQTGTPEGSIQLRPLPLNPLPGDLPNPLDVNFDHQVRLVGYELSPRSVRPGESIQASFYWQVQERPAHNFRVFAHLLGQENHIWAQGNGPLTQSPLEWSLDTPLKDERTFAIPADMPPGSYPLELGLRMPKPNPERLNTIAQDGHWIDDRVMLGPIRILPSNGRMNK